MKKVLAFIVLLSHFNFTMFLPTVEEQDVYYANGERADDINSLYEYVDQVLLGNIDRTPEDEDDDQPHFYQIIKVETSYYQQSATELKPNFSTAVENKFYKEVDETILPFPSYDIISPPPQVQ